MVEEIINFFREYFDYIGISVLVFVIVWILFPRKCIKCGKRSVRYRIRRNEIKNEDEYVQICKECSNVKGTGIYVGDG
jgi:hypothetical protein